LFTAVKEREPRFEVNSIQSLGHKC